MTMMRRFMTLAFAALIAAMLASCATKPSPPVARAGPLPLIPRPALVEPKPGIFRLRDGAALIVDSENAEAAAIARRFADLLAETRGIHLDVRPFGSHA